MEFFIVLSYLVCIFAGAAAATLISTKVFKRKLVEAKRKMVASKREKKIEKCIESLVEFNTALGGMKGAISNYIALGEDKYKDELEESQVKLLEAFQIFYRFEGYLLSMGMLETHDIMNEYITLISKLRVDFHFNAKGLSMKDFHESVSLVKACRKRLYSSLCE